MIRIFCHFFLTLILAIFVAYLMGCSSAEERAFQSEIMGKKFEYYSKQPAPAPLTAMTFYPGGGIKSLAVANPVGYGRKPDFSIPNSESREAWQTFARMLAIPISIFATGEAVNRMTGNMADVANTALMNQPTPVVVQPSYPPIQETNFDSDTLNRALSQF